MSDTPEAHRKYFREHSVAQLIDQLCGQLLETQPADPVSFLAEQLRIRMPKPVQPPAQWSVAFCWATDHVETANIETGAWRDLDKLTGARMGDGKTPVVAPKPGTVVVNILMDLYSTGAYRVEFDGDPRKDGMVFRSIDEPDMTSERLLADFLVDVRVRRPSKYFMVVFGGHGCAWLNLAEQGKSISVKAMANALRAAGGADLVCLDACLMGSLEGVSEFEGIAGVVTACENYCPWNGVVSRELLPALWRGTPPRELAVLLTQTFLANNCPSDKAQQLSEGRLMEKGDPSFGRYRTDDPAIALTPNPCDIFAADVQACVELYKWLKGLKLHPAYDADAVVDPSWPVLFDLATLTRRALATQPEALAELNARLGKCYLSRVASPDTPPTLTGLSVVRWPLPAGLEPWMDGAVDLNQTYPGSVTNVSPFSE